MIWLYFFFFSSRRRHTRSLRDWSSDVCSSDLPGRGDTEPAPDSHPGRPGGGLVARPDRPHDAAGNDGRPVAPLPTAGWTGQAPGCATMKETYAVAGLPAARP